MKSSMSNGLGAIQIRSAEMGEDLVLLVTGGKAHIGAAATAYFTGERELRIQAGVLPGHREGELAAELAELAARTCNRTVTVVAGIHLDHPSRQDIMDIVEEARRAMKQYLGGLHIPGRGVVGDRTSIWKDKDDFCT